MGYKGLDIDLTTEHTAHYVLPKHQLTWFSRPSERGTAVLPSLEEQASRHEMFTYVGRHITGAPLGLRPGLMVETRVYKALVPLL